MSRIRVVWGAATAPTEMASYDAALAAAGVHNYNLVAVSSVIPADAPVEAVGTAPDLGPAGERLTVVEGRATGAAPCRASACLGWSRTPGEPGLFYEASEVDRGARSPEGGTAPVERRVREGLDAGRALRDWTFDDEDLRTVSTEADADGYATAVVLAVYGESAPIC